MAAPALSIYPVPGLPHIQPGADLAAIISAAVRDAGQAFQDGDIFVIAQKIVSKAEGRTINLTDVTASPAAEALARSTDKDARVVELILRESNRVVRQSPGVIIVEHRLGIVLANAGIDRSNVTGDEDTVLLLPEDPDASASRLKTGLEDHLGVRLGVLITDSVGRPWRLGTTGIAIGCSGMTALQDLRGGTDLFGRVLQVAEVATADCLASAAGLIMGEGAEGIPVAVISGSGLVERASEAAGQNAKTLLRPVDEDLFRLIIFFWIDSNI
jgi:coenzyme F420-0:L-glutamate ligase/coenzyme F420-1:gamma-L-glutamate ligase